MTTHGYRSHPLYDRWSIMHKRCKSTRPKDWRVYGARGISVCDEWKDVSTFIKDMAPSYFNGATLERMDNEKGYSKENCKWATLVEQGANKRNNVIVTYNNHTACIAQWSRILGIPIPTLHKRIKKVPPSIAFQKGRLRRNTLKIGSYH